MIRPLAYALAAVVLAAQTGSWSCRDHDRNDDFIEDVTVEITGDSGTDFDAFFEDDDHSESVSADVPLTADFEDQEDFFRVIVDKDSSGTEEICVRIRTDHRSKTECTDDPFGRVSLSIVF